MQETAVRMAILNTERRPVNREGLCWRCAGNESDAEDEHAESREDFDAFANGEIRLRMGRGRGGSRAARQNGGCQPGTGGL